MISFSVEDTSVFCILTGESLVIPYHSCAIPMKESAMANTINKTVFFIFILFYCYFSNDSLAVGDDSQEVDA